MPYDGTETPDEDELTQGDIAAGYWFDVSTPTTMKFDADGLVWTQKSSVTLDNFEHIFGTGSDAGIYFDATNLIIRGKVNSVKTIFKNQNGSAVTKTLLTLDADKITAKIAGFQGTTLTITSDSDAVDVSGASVLIFDTTAGNITIGGFVNGSPAQVIFCYKKVAANSLIFEHNEGTGTEKILTADTNDITLTNYGGVLYVRDGTDWFEIGH